MTDCSLSNVDETASVHVSSLLCERRISDKTESISYPLKLKTGQQILLLLLFCFYIFVLGAVGTFIPEYISRNFCFDTG